jgi:FMN phosphatase YigB (HAD superfamily)
MVGDNLTADVRGAQRVGISGIWHDCNRLGEIPVGLDVVPDRIISSVRELA